MRARITAPATIVAAVAALTIALPAAAQFSDTYDLFKAVRDKDVEKARAILDKQGSTIVNAKESSSGDAPIHIVVKRRDIAWLGFILQSGADANLRDRDGDAPIVLATLGRWTEGVQLLTAIHVDVDRRNNAGETALIKAAQTGDTDDARVLLDAGANPDATDNGAGRSAREYALQRGGPIGKLLTDAPKKVKAAVQGPVR